MLDFLLSPLSAPFMQTALLEMLLLSLLTAVVGTYVVLRSLSFLSLALSHGIFPGLVLAYLLSWNYLLVSIVSAVIISLMIGLTGRSQRVGSDSAIAAMYTGAFALGMVMVSSTRNFRGLNDILFGRPFAITTGDLWLTALAVSLALAFMMALRKELLLAVFDRSMALAVGLPVERLEMGFLLVLAVSIIVALPAIGNIQLVALLVTPPATARLLAVRLPGLMLLAGLLSVLGSVTGLYLAYHFDLPAGSSIVVCLTILFLLALCFAPQRGLLPRYLARRALAGGL